MVTPVTPIRQSPLLLLQNAVEVCTAYGDEKNIAATSAQQQLGRIRGLIMQALASLEEPSKYTVDAMRHILDNADSWNVGPRSHRDAAAVITHTALTWGIGDDL